MKVVIGLIHRPSFNFLITQRSSCTDHGGLWEFPGGKIEPEEAPFAALQREIKEEVGLNIMRAERLQDVSYNYQSKQVTLIVYWVSEFSGEPRRCEDQQDLRWVPFKELPQYDFPEANKHIIEQIYKRIVLRTALVSGG